MASQLEATKPSSVPATTRTARLTVHGVQIPRAFAIRESDADRDLLEGMMDQTYRMFRQVPGVEEAMKLGLSPYDDPESVDGASPMRGDGYRAVSFVREGTLFIVWGGSAAKEDERGDNPFVLYLAQLLASMSVKDLYVSTFSRLVRSQNVQGRLRSALSSARTKIHCGSEIIDMGTENGLMMWDIQSLVYSMERDQIERRLVLGQIFSARRGEWMFNDTAVPPGYEVVIENDRRYLRVSDDPEEVERAKRMVEVLASEGSRREKVVLLDELGLTRSRNVRGGSQTYRAGETGDAGSFVRRLDTYRTIYATGTFIYRRVVPVVSDAIDEMGGYPVQRTEDGSPFVEVTVEVGTPPGGWASPKVFEAWDIEANRFPKNPGGAAHSLVKPLTGMCRYQDEGREYALLSDGRSAYVLRSRILDPERRHAGWDERKGESTHEARFDSALVHRSIAEGVRRALQDGHDIEVLDAEVTVMDDGSAAVIFVDEATRRAHLEVEVTRLQGRLKRLANLAAGSGPRLSQTYHDDATEVEEQLEVLDRRLAEVAEARPAPQAMVVHGRTLFRALDALSAIETSTTRRVASAIRTVLGDLRWRIDGETAWWTLDVHLPTSEGLAVLRGVTGEVSKQTLDLSFRCDRERSDTNKRLLDALYTNPTDEACIDSLRTFGQRVSLQRLGAALKESGFTDPERRLIYTHPIPEVRGVIVADRLGRPAPNGLAARWLSLVRAAVAGHADVPLRNIAAAANPIQAVVDLLADAGSPVTPQELVALVGTRRSRVLARIGYHDGADGVAIQPGVVQLASYANGMFTPLVCSTCKTTRWEFVRLPEFEGMVCRDCLVATDGTLFPSAYLAWRHVDALGRRVRLMEHEPDRRTRHLPDGVFTAADWADACGIKRGQIGTDLRELVAAGLIEDLGRDEAHVGPGLTPRQYQRVVAQGGSPGKEVTPRGAEA